MSGATGGKFYRLPPEKKNAALETVFHQLSKHLKLCQKYSAAHCIFPNFQNCARCKKDFKDNKHNSLHLGQKYARIIVFGHYLFLIVCSRKTVCFSEQIMSMNKYPSIFLHQMEAIVYLHLH